MRSYDVAIASLALNAPLKWTDNTIAQHRIKDVLSARRGVARRISFAGLVRLAVIRQIHTCLGSSVADAVRIANQLLDSGSIGVHDSGQLRLTVDVASLERELNQRLADALESAPSRTRGRPPRSSKT